MRDIRFRAWDKVNNKMLSHKDMLDGSWDNWPTLFFAITDNDIYIPMQFTGLKDCKGKEWFDGEILDGINMHRMIVVFHKYGWCIKFKDQGMEYIEPITDDFIENFEPYSIGNIYENPNLIKEVL